MPFWLSGLIRFMQKYVHAGCDSLCSLTWTHLCFELPSCSQNICIQCFGTGINSTRNERVMTYPAISHFAAKSGVLGIDLSKLHN